jgi:hypothetical protein
MPRSDQHLWWSPDTSSHCGEDLRDHRQITGRVTPAKAAAAILTALAAERPPLRLPLGDDAVENPCSPRRDRRRGRRVGGSVSHHQRRPELKSAPP